MFFEGTPSSWATGSKSSMTFINSNVIAHQVALSISPSKQDTTTLRYATSGPTSCAARSSSARRPGPRLPGATISWRASPTRTWLTTSFSSTSAS
jgi:hypothetical protein